MGSEARVKGIKINEITRYSDYKKFNVETLSTIAKPKGTGDPSVAPKQDPQL